MPLTPALPFGDIRPGPSLRSLARCALGLALTLAAIVPLALATVGGIVLLIHAHGTPALSIRTLTDGKRTAVYIEMLHVAGPAFYRRVGERIRDEGALGATYLYEGLDGSAEDLDRLTGISAPGSAEDGLGRLFDTMAKVADLQAQPHFRGLTGRPDIWADMPIAEMLDAPEGEQGLGMISTAAPNGLLRVAALARWTGWFREGGTGRAAARLAMRSLITYQVTSSQVLGRSGNRPGVLFEGRERRLRDVIEATEGDVVITYGAGHYRGLMRLLGPGWTEVSAEANPIFE